MIVLKGRVLDGNGGAPTEKGAVVLEDNRIRLVCRQSELPDDPTAEVYELEDGTIMPGLIDAHVHMGWGSATAVDWISMTPQLSMARALRDMAQLRQQGYTAFRDLGSDVLLMRPAVAEGLLDVPRIFGAGRIISQIGGHGDVYQKLSLEASQQAYSPAFIVNGVDEVRRACRINARNGADLIKIMTTGGVFSQGDKATPHSHFSQEEIRAAVEEAENMGSYVSTHAQATRGIKMALKNGVKCIEHGFYLDEECIELMVKNDCYLVPTLAIMHASKLYFQGKEGVLPYLKEKTERSYEAHYRSLEMARKAHITVGVGCDFLGDAAFGCPYSEATLELERLCVAGYTPMEVITMATKVNARLLQMEDQLGTLETGKLADVLLVEGRPDEDIRVLRRSDHVKLVVQDGRIVKNAMPHTAKA
ncbi:MAG: amidohydrolase family protein [Oscillospiraceae bacterium]|nr:amidohydrolase family protein [Oscillospiraceae bacterium]